jgi:hypothetical protein
MLLLLLSSYKWFSESYSFRLRSLFKIQERDRQQLMQRLSCHMREVLALPIVIEDGSKVRQELVFFFLSYHISCCKKELS